MFGFLVGDRCDAVYRQVYAGCCSVQHTEFGLESLFFLSYEAIFVYLFAMDEGNVAPPPTDAATCCRLRTSERIKSAVDQRHAKFASAFGILLADIKLKDDVQDDNSWLARIASWRLRGRISKARDYFTQLDPDFEPRVSEYLNRHAALERVADQRIESYVQPTAEAFGYLFGLSSKLYGNDVSQSIGQTLRDAGQLIGSALIAFDCVVDWNRDRRSGNYNPLQDTRSRAEAKQFSQRCIAQAIWLCADQLGEDSRCVSVLQSTFRRLSGVRLSGPKSEVECVTTQRRRRRAFSLPRIRGGQILRHGDCDCDCDACCQVAECCSGGDGLCCQDDATGIGCCFPNSKLYCDSSCCDPICCDCPTCSRHKRDEQQHPSAPSEPPQYVGKTGITVGALKPSGLVEVDGQQFPAKSESSTWVDDGVAVRVTAESAAGLIVKQI